MPYKKESIHNNRSLDNRKESFREYAPTKQEYDKVMEYLRLLSLGEVSNRPVGEHRQQKILDMLIVFYRNLKKVSTKLTLEDLRSFKESLLKDKISQVHGNKPYSEATKEDITGVLMRYLEWRIPANASKWSLRKWFKIKAPKATPEYLTEEEVERLYNSCKSNEERYFVAVLFDTGARIEECLNIRFEDIIPPTEGFPYYKIDIKTEYSKTVGRIPGCYWKHTATAIREYLKSIPRGHPKDRVLTKNYDAVRFFLRRLGNKVLGKRVHAHLFRKSSATYYAPKLNRQELCYRYGWVFSSDVVDIYIARAGMKEENVKEKILNTDLSRVEKENQELQAKFAVMKDQNEREMQEFKENLLKMVSRLANVESKKQKISVHT